MTDCNKRKYVSDIIGENYKNWGNEYVILDCGTGSGKTFFCVNVLGKYAETEGKKILYLCNRSKLRDQVHQIVEKVGLNKTVDITTYQALKKKIVDHDDIPYYDYIVADECHYFVSDANFNDYTDITYDYIMAQQEKSTVLLVSATAKVFFQSLVDSNLVKDSCIYRIDKDYSYVDKLYYYKCKELEYIIDEILEREADTKAVVFCNSGKRIAQMYQKYGDNADYYCSKSAKDETLRRICGWDDGKVNHSIKRYSDNLVTFEKRILFTTTALDNGVDLKDTRIKHIFSELIDTDVMIQAFGRKRSLGDGDTCCFYIRLYQPKGLQGFANIKKFQLKPAFLYKYDKRAFYEAYGEGKDRLALKKNEIFYDYFNKNIVGEVRINERKYKKYLKDYRMLCQMKNFGYKNYLEKILDKSLVDKSEDILCNAAKTDAFIEFLKSLEGKRLYADDQKRIKAQFEEIGVKLRYVGIATFNGALDDKYKDLYRRRFFNKNTEGKIYRDNVRKYKNDEVNPNFRKCYWTLEDRNHKKMKI